MADLFLIHGLKYSGKSTLAERLMGEHGFERVKMAGPLKNMVRSLLRDAAVPEELIESYVEGELKEVPIPELGGTTARRLMMTLGDEWRNMHGERLWADVAVAKAASLLAAGRDVVIDDIRYPFEIEAMARFDPMAAVVTRGTLHFEPYGEDRHPGERPMPVGNFDFHFLNDFETKDELWAQLDLVLQVRRDFTSSKASYRADLASLAWPLQHAA